MMAMSWLLLLASLTFKANTHALSSTCTTQTHEDGLRVDCSGRQLTSLPVTWPDDVLWLDMSHNHLTILTNLTYPHLAKLRHLDLSYNRIHGTLANNTFSSLRQLRWLSLNSNFLQGLEEGTFTSLAQLVFLDLSSNKLLLHYDAYPRGVFSPLTSLQQLQLQYNDDRWVGEYPDDIFRPLTSLRSLQIDTFSDAGYNLPGTGTNVESPFGPGFGELKNLRELRLEEAYCNLNHLSNLTLDPFRGSLLEELRLGSHPLTTVDSCAFCDFPHLKSLQVTSMNIPVTKVLNSLYGLQHQNMTVIYFGRVNVDHGVDLTKQDTRFLMNICVSKIKLPHTNIQWIPPDALYEHDSLFARCVQEIDLSENRLYGDRRSVFLALSAFGRLASFRLDQQRVYNMRYADCILGQRWDCANVSPPNPSDVDFPWTPSLVYLNVSSMGGRFGSLPSVIKVPVGSSLKVLDVSNVRITGCYTTFVGITSLETLALSGNYCYNISEEIFDNLQSVRELRMSDVNLNPHLFRTRAWRIFQKLELLQTLDLSLNNLIHVDPDMLRAQRHLKELVLAGNRLQSLSVNLEPHGDLELLDLSHNMLPTLLPTERQALDKLASGRIFRLRLRGNPLLCACSNLDFVRWLWSTAVEVDGDGNVARNYTCVTDSGEISDTHSVMMHYDFHWRRCVGQTMLGAASAAFLLQLLVLVIVYVVSRSWTHLRYLWKVMKRLRLPRREHFRWDAYVGYADADWEFACLTLPACLEERHGVRLLLRDREELPGSIRAESIVEHIDESWKVLLLVTRHFATDEWACGFTVQQAQRSITDTMPDRVIVVFMEDPARLPPMASLERLLRMVPERNVHHVHRDIALGPPLWDRLARDILGDSGRH